MDVLGLAQVKLC